MITIDTSLFYAIVVYAVIGVMVAGYWFSQFLWKTGEHFSAKKKLVQTQKELAEAQLQALKGRGL
jgi:H+/gluconate symporter-like permease